MPVFVHLTSEKNVASIRRNGIALRKKRFRPRGVYAMPVTRNFSISHQWVRELKRWGAGTVVAIYFRVADDQMVEVGHYNSVHLSMTAAEATALMLSAEKLDPGAERTRDQKSKNADRGRQIPSSPEGFEVIIPRKIERSEITKIRLLPQVVGWRYMPGANGRPPCTCRCCEKGMYGAGKLLRAVEKAESRDRATKVIVFGRNDASYRRVERLRQKRKS